MDEDRIHRAISDDGTEIAGHVHGQGRPLVFVHGGLEDGDLCWASLMPYLGKRFTCYLLSTRNRGLSGEHPDLSPDRLVQDVTAFVESIGEPVGLVGESSGGMVALGAASRSNAVSALAVYEPVVFEVISEEDAGRIEVTATQVGELAAKGRLADAARTFVRMIANDDELGALMESGYLESSERYIPVLLGEVEQAQESHDYSPTDPSELEGISAPVLLMHGSRTALDGWFTNGVRHVAGQVADSEVRVVDGAGHWAVALQPETIAEEITLFFEARLEPPS